MKRKSKFIIVTATALLTFGTLMATVGSRHFNHHMGYCCHHDRCGLNQEEKNKTAPTNSTSTETHSDSLTK